MSIRFAVPAFALALAGVALSGSANAQASVMQDCGKEYQAAKTANTLAGKSWNEYLKDCRVRHAAQPAAAAPAAAAPAAAPAANPLKPAATTTTAPAAATAAAPAPRQPMSPGRAAENTAAKRPVRRMALQQARTREGQSQSQMAAVLERVQHAHEGRWPVIRLLTSCDRTPRADVSGAFFVGPNVRRRRRPTPPRRSPARPESSRHTRASAGRA